MFSPSGIRETAFATFEIMTMGSWDEHMVHLVAPRLFLVVGEIGEPDEQHNNTTTTKVATTKASHHAWCEM